MGFLTGSATTIDDLFTQISTFLTGSPGWTQDGTVGAAGFGFSKNNIFAQFRYDGTSPVGAGRHLAVYQSLGYTGGLFPGEHPDDSGNGFEDSDSNVADSSLDNERGCTDFGDGPFENFWVFQDTGPDEVSIVVEVRQDEFRHFGFGLLDKFGDGYTGGEYVYAQRWLGSSANDTTAHILLDGKASSLTQNLAAQSAATIHLEGLQGQDPASKWGICFANLGASGAQVGTDGGGNPRVLCPGTARAGFRARNFGGFGGTSTTGLIPGTPVGTFYVKPQDGIECMYLGDMVNARMVNVRNFQPRQEVSISGDDWLFFPVSIRTTETASPPSRSSFVSGVMYRKVP